MLTPKESVVLRLLTIRYFADFIIEDLTKSSRTGTIINSNKCLIFLDFMYQNVTIKSTNLEVDVLKKHKLEHRLY